jgi:hypothetical protein
MRSPLAIRRCRTQLLDPTAAPRSSQRRCIRHCAYHSRTKWQLHQRHDDHSRHGLGLHQWQRRPRVHVQLGRGGEWQPLDVSVFSPLKRALATETDAASRLDSSRIPRIEWTSMYIRAREQALRSSNIVSGWKATGLWPLSPIAVLEKLPAQPATQPLEHDNATPYTGLDLSFLLSDPPTMIGDPSQWWRSSRSSWASAMCWSCIYLISKLLIRRHLHARAESSAGRLRD